MKLELIKDRISKIASHKGDDEVAHCEEDQLYYDFVEYISKKAPKPFKQLAAEVMKVRKLDFARWHA